MADHTGLVACSLDIATIDGPGVAGQGTPVTQIIKVDSGTFDARSAAALLRATADRLDPQPAQASWHPHQGHKPGCRCVETSITGRTRDVGGHPDSGSLIPRGALPDHMGLPPGAGR